VVACGCIGFARFDQRDGSSSAGHEQRTDAAFTLGAQQCTNAAVALVGSQQKRTDAAFALGDEQRTDAPISLVVGERVPQ